MSLSKLPNPIEFVELHLSGPELKKNSKARICSSCKEEFTAPDLYPQQKNRVFVCIIASLAIVGGTVAAALFISTSTRRDSQVQAAFSAQSSLPSITTTRMPLQLTLMRTTMVTQTSVVTG